MSTGDDVPDLLRALDDSALAPLAAALRGLRAICAALAAAVLAYAVLVGVLVARPLPHATPDSLALTFGAMVLLLVSSRVRSTSLRRAVPRDPRLRPDPAAVLAAYRRATLTSFALLELSALLGLAVALLSGSRFYGWVICAAVLLAMLARWPRAAEVDRILRRRLAL
jgi:hypothetical protein